ncbi:MAG: hypothetical protein ACWGNV_13155 [Bacteroidales bacterium]
MRIRTDLNNASGSTFGVRISRFTRSILSMVILLMFLAESCHRNSIPVPELSAESWKISTYPDLDSLNGPDPLRQDIVDHGFIQVSDSSWRLWACIRGTAVGRILYGWTGNSLEGPSFEETGIVVRADSGWGEQVSPEEKMQAPYFMPCDSGYYCFYNSNGLRIMYSPDGQQFRRIMFRQGSNLVFDQSGRDVMILKHQGIFYAYSTISTISADGWKSGFIVVRTSEDLHHWSDYTVVSSGGMAGNGPVSAESPFVLYHGDYFYLFRSSSITGKCYVYASDNPYQFGVNDDSRWIATLPLKAPEIIRHRGDWYISDLDDFRGIRLRKLVWK